MFIPDSADGVPAVVQQLSASGVDLKRVRPIGTGLWDDQRLFSNPLMEGAQFALPTPPAARLRGPLPRPVGTDPVRTATLSYDAVSLVSSVVRSQGRTGSPMLP